MERRFLLGFLVAAVSIFLLFWVENLVQPKECASPVAVYSIGAAIGVVASLTAWIYETPGKHDE